MVCVYIIYVLNVNLFVCYLKTGLLGTSRLPVSVWSLCFFFGCKFFLCLIRHKTHKSSKFGVRKSGGGVEWSAYNYFCFDDVVYYSGFFIK
jgi:hypothetical protein